MTVEERAKIKIAMNLISDVRDSMLARKMDIGLTSFQIALNELYAAYHYAPEEEETKV